MAVGESVSGDKIKELKEAIKNYEAEGCDENVKTKLVELLDQKQGFKLQKYNRENLRILLELFLLNDIFVSKQIQEVLSVCLSLEEKSWVPPTDIFESECIVMIKDKLMPNFLDQLERTKSKDVLRQWSLVVRMLGKHLHAGADLINKVMKVVEKGFKIPETLVESYIVWKVLMDNFALDTRILTSGRRVTLLQQPMVRHRVDTEAGIKVKFETWWYFLVLLGPHLHHHLQTVVLPFLRFCYGPSDPSKVDNQPGKSPGTPSTPAKKFSALDKLILDALIQLFGCRPLDPSLPRSSLSSSLSSSAFLPMQVAVHADEVLFTVMEATKHVKPANKSEVIRVQHIWAGVANLLAQVKESNNQLPGFHQYFAAVKLVVAQHRRSERLCHLLISIINNSSKLPTKILTNSTILSNKDKPYSLLLDLLLYSDFIQGSNKSLDVEAHNLFLETFTKLTEICLHPNENIQSLDPVLDKLELAVANLSGSGLAMINEMWQILAKTAGKLENLSEQNNDRTSTTFTTALHLLKFPLQFLSGSKGGEDKTVLIWEKVYKAVLEQGEMSVHHSTGYIVSEMADRLENVLKMRETSCQLMMNSRIILKMMDNIDWAGVARSLKTGHHPLAGFERMMNPLGNITNLINHLKHCTEVLVNKKKESLDAEVAKQILKSYQKIFSINQQELIRPLLKSGTATAFSAFLHEDLIVNLTSFDASVLADIEKVFTTLCTLIKVKYNKDYSMEFLTEIEQFFLISLGSSRKSLRNQANEMWMVTFATISKEKLPEQIVSVLKSSSSVGVRSGVSSGSDVSFPDSSSDGGLSQQIIAEPGILVGLQKQTVTSDKMETPQLKEVPKKKPRKSLCLQLEDEDSAMFVPIKSTPKGKRVLTDHQRDVLTSRHDDIPALYSELSRDDSIVMLPSQFSSQDSLDESKQGDDNSNSSQSLLKSMKSRKNQRFEIPDSSRSLRRGRSKEKSDDEEIVISSQSDLFADGSNNDEFKKPDKPDDNTDNANESENKVLDESSQSSVNNSISSVEDVIESSQDVTMESGAKPRRSRRKTVEKANNEADTSVTSTTSTESVDDKKNKWGETSLFVAVKKGEVEKIKELLKQGSSCEISNSTGFYPLHEAAISSKDVACEIIKILTKSGANVDIISESGVTPLHEAIRYGGPDQVRTLLQAGADIEIKTKNGKTSFDLTEKSSGDGILDVIRKERKDYVEKCEKEKTESTENEDKLETTEDESSSTKQDNVDNNTNDEQESKVEEMECDTVPSVSDDPPSEKLLLEKLDNDKKNVAGSPECNKENVNSDDGVEEDKKDQPSKQIDPPKPKLKSPFTGVNTKQKKPLTPGSRGAMILNLSRRVSLDQGNDTTHVSPRVPMSSQTRVPVSSQTRVQAVAVSPMRPWAKYAPSPSHASPSAGILKRSADDLDSPNDGSPVSAKRLRLDITGSSGGESAPRRVHFNENPVSESVEIPRTPKQQFTRKKLQMSALVETEDKDVEIEGVTSLVMYPDLVDNKDSVNGVLYSLATGQWSRFLEQDLKSNNITTIGQLAALDVKTVGQLRGVKPPKQQTVKIALAAYHNKIKKEETSFRKGTPVQEETSQEEEERIKAEFFSRPSPSPTDMAAVLDAETDEPNVEMEHTANGDEGNQGSKDEEEKVDGESEIKEGKNLDFDERKNKVLVDESPEDENEVKISAEDKNDSPKFVSETETMTVEQGEDEAAASNTTENVIQDEPQTQKTLETSEVEKSDEITEDPSPNHQNMDEAASPDQVSSPAEAKEDKTETVSAANPIVEDNNENDIVQDNGNGLNEPSEETNPEVDLSKIMAVLEKTDLDLTKCSNESLKRLYNQAETFKGNVAKILFGRLN